MTMPIKDPAKRRKSQQESDRKRAAERVRDSDKPRAVTLSASRVPYKLRVITDYPEGVERPMTRGECRGGPRPCPFVSCRHHLYLDVSQKGGLKLNFPQLEPEQLVASCSLDVAEQGLSRLEDAGALMNLTRERVRQVEVVALRKLALKRVLREIVNE